MCCAPAWGQQATPVIIKEVQLKPFVDRVEALGTLRASETVDLTATITDTVTATLSIGLPVVPVKLK